MKDKYERAVEVIYRMKDNVAAGLPEMHGILHMGKPAKCTFETMGRLDSFTIAPRTHIVNTFEVPAPESERPEHGSKYFYIHHAADDGALSTLWSGGLFDTRMLKFGNVFLTKEAAILNQKAQAGIDPYGEE